MLPASSSNLFHLVATKLSFLERWGNGHRILAKFTPPGSDKDRIHFQSWSLTDHHNQWLKQKQGRGINIGTKVLDYLQFGHLTSHGYEEQAVLRGLVPCSSVQTYGFEQKQDPGGTLSQQLEQLDPALTEEVGRPWHFSLRLNPYNLPVGPVSEHGLFWESPPMLGKAKPSRGPTWGCWGWHLASHCAVCRHEATVTSPK